MKIKVVGIERLDYFSRKRNRQVVGETIHYVDIGTQRERLDGYMVGTQFISADNRCYGVPLTVGATYTMYLNGYNVDYLRPDSETLEADFIE